MVLSRFGIWHQVLSACDIVFFFGGISNIWVGLVAAVVLKSGGKKTATKSDKTSVIINKLNIHRYRARIMD